MKSSFLKKYQPKMFNEFIIDNNVVELLNTLINTNELIILFIGSEGCGKTSLIKSTINEYYGDQSPDLNDILYINSLKEQGIQYYRTELKTFCQTKSSIYNKKKFIVLDDIDNINEQSQQVFRNCIDKYKKNINILCSCNNLQKVIESIQSRCLIVYLNKINKNMQKEIFLNITSKENIEYDDDCVDFLINLSNGSIRLLINFLEKFKILNYKITNNTIKEICTNISFMEFEKYTNYVLNKKYKEAINTIFNIHTKGYSVMDILDSYFQFIKNTNMVNESIKYEIIKIICKFITIFHKLHESKIELAIFTNNLIKLI